MRNAVILLVMSLASFAQTDKERLLSIQVAELKMQLAVMKHADAQRVQQDAVAAHQAASSDLAREKLAACVSVGGATAADCVFTESSFKKKAAPPEAK